MVEDPSASINAAGTCIIASAEVLSIATDEYTIADSEDSTVSSNDDDELLMSLSEVAEIKESPLQMDVPAVQEEKKDATLVVFIDDNEVASIEDVSGTYGT